MEIHAVAGGWVLEWSGTSSSICKTTLSVAGLLVVAGTVVGTVKQHRHRQFVRSCQQRDDDDSKQEKTEQAQNGAVEAGGGAQVTRAMASEMALVDKGGNSRANSRIARVGRGLESVGGTTESTFHRLTNVVGSVVKLPVVLMTKVGGFASPQPASLPSSQKPVEDRVFQLEIQMKNLEDKLYSSTTVTELCLSPRMEKPPIARSLLLDMETEPGASVERVELLEDRINSRMESIEKAMSAIQDQLAMVNLKPATVVYQRQESMPNEEYHDAEQQSDNSEALEAKIGEAPEASFSSTSKAIEEREVEKSGDVREPYSVAVMESVESEALEAKSGEGSFGASSASTTEAVEKLETEKSSEAVEKLETEKSSEAVDTETSGDIVGPQLVTEVVERSDEDVGVSPASVKGQQLAATLEELHEGFVMEPSAAAAAVKFVEIARADHAEESCIPPAPPEAEPRVDADSEQPAQEEVIDTMIKSPLASTVEDAREDHVKEPLVAAPVQELAAGEESITVLEPQVASKDVELPSTGLGELLQEDRGVIVPAAESSSEESHVKERALQEDSGAEPQVVPGFFEEVAESVPGANFEEPGIVAKLPSSEEPQEEFAKPEPLAESPQIPVTQEGSDRALASSEPQEEPFAHVESVKLKEHPREDATDESGTMIEESPKESQEDETESSAGASSVEPAADEGMGESSDAAFASAPKDGAGVKESQEAVEESSAGAPSIKSAAEEDRSEDEDVAFASSETEHVEDPVQSADLKEHAPEDATDESRTMLEESPSKKSQGDVTESSAGALSMEPATEEEDLGSERSDMTLAFAPKDGADAKESEEDMAGAPSIKPPTEEVSSEGSGLALAEEPSAGAEGADVKEHAPEDATGESDTMIEESPSSSSMKSQEDVTETSADMGETSDMAEPQLASKHVELSSAGSEELAHEDVAHKSGIVVDSSAEESHEDLMKDLSAERAPHEEIGMALPPSEPQSVEEPSAHVGENSPEDATDKSGTMIEESPSSSSKKSQEDVTETSAGASSIELTAEADMGESSDMAEPQVASKHVELSSAGSEELAHEDVAHKSGIVEDSSAEESHEDLVKDLSAERAPHETGMALPPSEPQSVEEPSAHVGENSPEDAADESGTMIEESSLSLSKKSQDDVTESSAGASSIEPAAEEDLGESSDLALTSAEPQVAPKHVEVSSAEEIPHADVAFKSGIAAESSPEENQEDRVKELSAERAPQEKPSAHVESADLGEHAPEDATNESGSMVEEAPFSSSKKSQEDVTESSAGAQSVEPAAEDSGKKNVMAEPQVAPEFVEEVPSASEVPSTQKDGADEDGTMLAAVAESPSEEVQEAVVKEDMQELATPEDFGEKGETTVASRELQVPSSFDEKPSAANFEEPDEDAPESELPVREALAMEPQAGGDGTSLDAQLGSNSEAPPEEFVQGSSEACEEEPAQEYTGIAHLAVGSPLLASKAEEEAKEDTEQGQTEAEDKIAVDEQVEDTEEASPRSQSTSAPAGSEEFKPDTLESESSEGQVFFDAEDEEAFEPEQQPAHEPENERAHVPEQPAQVPDQPAQVPEQQPAQEPAQEPGQELAQVPVHQPSEEPARETEHQQAQEREYQPEQVLEHEPARERAQEPEQGFAHVPEQLPAQVPGRELAQVPEHQPGQEPDEPARETEIQPAQEREYQPELKPAREPAKERAEEPEQEFSDVSVHQPDQETDSKSAQEFAQIPAEEPEQDVAQSSEVDERDPAQDDPMAIAPASSEPQAASSSEEQQEKLAEHPLKVAPDVKFEEPAQELPQQSLGGKSAHLEEERGEAPVAQKASVDEPLVVAPRVEPAQAPAQEREAEPAQEREAEPAQEREAEPAQKLEPEPVQEPEAEPARQPGAEPARQPAAKEHEAEPAQAPAQEREAEPAQKPEAEPAREPAREPEVELAREFEGEPARVPEAEPAREPEGEPAREPEGELARGAEVEPVRGAGAEPARQPEVGTARGPEAEPARGPEAEPARGPEAEPARGPEAELARGPEVETAQEPVSQPAREHEAEPAQEREAEPAQEPVSEPAREPESQPAQEEEEFHDTTEGSGPLEPVTTLEQKSFDETSVAAGTSSTPLVAGHDAAGTSDHQNESSKPQVSHTLEEAETAQVGDHDASSEVQPTSSSQEAFSKEPPAAEEPIASPESQAAPKSVKFAEEPSVVELPEQSDTDTSTTALQAPLTAITEGQQQLHDSLIHDSAEVQIPAELKGAAEAPTIQLPDAPPASQQTETAKHKHGRKKGFTRSTSEPKFDYHLHDSRKSLPSQESTLAPTSSTAHQESALVPTSSTAYQDDVDWDVQCLPFRIMSHGEGRPRRESESKSVEDVQSPTTPTNVALESKLSRRLEKKKDKERRHSFRLEAKQEKDKESRRHSLNLDAIDRKGSLASTAEESDTPRSQDIVVKQHKGPFKHLRNRLRHAFSVNKDVTP